VKDVVNMKEKQTIKKFSLLTSALLLLCKYNISHTSWWLSWDLQKNEHEKEKESLAFWADFV